MVNIFKIPIIVYGSFTTASLVYNRIFYSNKLEYAYERTYRKLKYRDLTTTNNLALMYIREDLETKKKMGLALSTMPIIQVVHTINILNRDQEFYDNMFLKSIDQINKEELESRKRFLEGIKRAKNVPEEIAKKMEKEDYLPSEKEYRLVLKANESKNKNKKRY